MSVAITLRSPLLGSAMLLIMLANLAHAQEFCVDSADALRSALTTAQSNNETDEIRIVQGTYVGNFIYVSTEALSVLGGFVEGCSTREVDPENTILDGNQTNLVLKLLSPNGDTEYTVEGLTLRNGRGTSGMGGGLFAAVGWGGLLTVTDNLFLDNAIFTSAGATNFSSGGGVYVFGGTSTFIGNRFIGNSASTTQAFESAFGGGVSVIGSGTFIGNHFERNTVSTRYYAYGGGVFIESGAAVFIRNSFTGNAAWSQYQTATGGGVTVKHGAPTFINNSFSGNIASNGGGVSITEHYSHDSYTVKFTNNSFQGNRASIGGGLDLFLPPQIDGLLYNNLFWENISDLNQGADLKIDNAGGAVMLSHNSFDQREPEGISILNPIALDATNLNTVDPLFSDAVAGDLRLSAGSPMIDAGDPATPKLPEVDLDGNPRVFNGVVDIGAYEFVYGGDPKAIPTLSGFSTFLVALSLLGVAGWHWRRSSSESRSSSDSRCVE